MATVYIQPGSGTGTGSEADPYYYSQLSTAETAAGSGGKILFTDGSYDTGTFDASGVTYEAVNLHAAIITGATDVTFGSSSNSVNAKKFKVTLASSSRIEIHGATSVCDQLFVEAANSFNVRPRTSGVSLTNTLMKLSLTTGANYGREWGNFGKYEGNTLFITDLNGRSANAVSCHTSILASGIAKNSIFVTDDTANNVITSGDQTDANSSNCCFFQFGSGNTSGGTNNVFSNPLFVDSASDDYRLRPASPCINAGIAT